MIFQLVCLDNFTRHYILQVQIHSSTDVSDLSFIAEEHSIFERFHFSLYTCLLMNIQAAAGYLFQAYLLLGPFS